MIFQDERIGLRRLKISQKGKELEVNQQYTIEHIMPQNANLTDEWKKELGPEWERVHETWLHTIGNLTLTGYNSEYSDKPFSTKRDMGNGFRDSPIKFNQSLRNVDVWNEDSIKERAQQLSNLATKVWEAPKLSPDVLNYFKPKGKEVEDRSIDDYPYLSYSNGTYIKEIRELFDALRKEVLSMDTIVIEDHLRRYIAFKGETNFLDVVPQTKRLRLSLNMPYKEIDDPMNITNDVSNIGRWGNGDVEVGFSNMKDLPYIMNLVRQSFDWQMNEE